MTTARPVPTRSDATGIQPEAWAFGAQHRLDFDAACGPAPAFDRSSNAALLERIRTLRTILPTMATEVAIARREGARLRRENEALRSRLASGDDRRTAANDVTPTRRESR
jgi:hypothetical protein